MKTTKSGKKTTNNNTPNGLENSSRQYKTLVDKASKMKTDADATGALIDAEVYRRWSLEPAAMNHTYARKNEDSVADFGCFAEPFAMGNMLIFRKPEGLEYEVSVNGGEWTRGVFTVGGDGCTARTRTKITVGWGKEYEPKL